MAGKPAFTFGFAKKAEPKKYVAALSLKKADDREEIKGINAEGQLELEKPKEGQGPPVIKCKNPLDAPKHAAAKKAPDNGEKPKVLDKPLEDLPGGIVSGKNMEKLSTEDAEAMRELLKDAAREDDGNDGSAVAAMPILMKVGSKKVREGNAPEATKEMFENVAVESFGEAMLRGMGYDPNMHKTKPIFRDKLRDNCLGLGAQALLPGEKLKISGKRPAAPKAAGGSVAKASSIAAAATEATEEVPAAVETAKRPRTDDVEQKSKPVDVVDVSADIWACRGLVVRVISKEGQLKDFFGAEAVILEVDESKQCCRIKARPNGGDKSQQLKGVQLQDVETRVSRDCQKVRIVRGAQKGSVAKLLKRDSAKGIALLQIEGVDSTMSLDDVCQFME